MTTADNRVEQPAESRKLDNLFDQVDDLLVAGRFGEVDKFIRTFPVGSSPIVICIGLLTVCGAARPELNDLKEIDNLRRRVRSRITELAPDRVETLMYGLEGKQ